MVSLVRTRAKLSKPTLTFQPWARSRCEPSSLTKEPSSSSAVHTLPVVGVGDAVALLVVGLLRRPLEGRRQALALDRAVVGRDAEGGDVVLAGVDLGDREDGVVVGGGDLATGGGGLEGPLLERLEPVGGADEALLRGRVGQQEDDVARRRVAVRGEGQRVDRGVGHLLDRGALDGRDRLLLGAAVPVAEVRERGRDRVDDGDDLEGDEEERARQQVLHRHGAGGQVDVERQCGDGHQDGQAPPVVGSDQREGRPDRDGGHEGEADDLDHQHQRAAGAVGAEPEPGPPWRPGGDEVLPAT